jgi:hypothetical protein
MRITLDLIDAERAVLHANQVLPEHIREHLSLFGVRYSGNRRAWILSVEVLPAIWRFFEDLGHTPEVQSNLEEWLRQRWVIRRARETRLEQRIKSAPLHPRPHQEDGALFLVQRARAILADPTGSGKTATVLLAVDPEDRVLGVVPATAMGTWLREMAQWTPDRLVKIVGPKVRSFAKLNPNYQACSRFCWPEPREAVLVTPDRLPDIYAGWASREEDWGEPPEGIRCFADEVEAAFRVPETQRTSRFRSLCRAILRNNGSCWLTTATMYSHRPEDLWTVLDHIGLAEPIFGTRQRFVHLTGGKLELIVQSRKTPRHAYVWPRDPIIAPEVYQSMKPWVLRRSREEIMPWLPPITRQVIPVTLPSKVTYVCNEVLDELERLDVDLDRALESAATYQKGAAFEALSRASAAIAEAKVPAMLELILAHERAEEPLLVASAHLAPLESLRQREGWAVIDGSTPAQERAHYAEAFQRGELLGLGLSIRACGRSLTLDRAAHMLIVDPEWGPGDNIQAEGRITRLNQRRSVLIRYLQADHVIDERRYDILFGKLRTLQELETSLEQTVETLAT